MSVFLRFEPSAAISASVVEEFAARVPEELSELWRNRGHGRIGDGFVRLLDPSRLEDRLGDWFDDPRDAVAIASTSLGDLILWHGDRMIVARPRDGVCEAFRGSVREVLAALESDVFILVWLDGGAAASVAPPDADIALVPTPPPILGGRADHGRLVAEPFEAYWDAMTALLGKARLPAADEEGGSTWPRS